ncbi:MAG TPA: zinc ribbon domain-containing protein [Candidatus Hydrogenedentes bacterium]|nr:zinc ribbon domain-containing protein [Candidatus Hydrogenedentota bacterium]HPC15130.1 zinc ribbon domain-containing protein [Candidatus Hydrogenedentota bacterium]HRT21866.1 zinc ribbon domain-containing protein [Candidatus Hydrogenedentota bacterium]HRT64129.1 zinc ribbon domain-containing protein [Candidatus Hydrogenedentota bacterium]
MPTYSYQCKKCGHVQDLFHAISANPRVKCEACGGACKRLLGTGAGIIFKGSGFYQTDYKKDGKKAASPAEGKGETKSEAKSESKAETKTETKPAAKASGAAKE